MKHTTSAGKRSLIGALALSLMLGFGVCRPAATASAEDSLLAEHKDEIVDTIMQARENLRNTLDDIRAIRDIRKKPSTSELIDWINALQIGGIDYNTLKEKLPFIGVVVKKDEDLETVRHYVQ